MKIRDKFREQKRQNGDVTPDLAQKSVKPAQWQEDFLEKMASRIEKVIVEHSAQWAQAARENPEIAEDLQRIAEKKPPRRISFDDISGILEMLKNENKE